MTREEALKLVKRNVKTKNLVKHMIAAEAVMAELAKHLSEDKGKWGLAGLLHDIDYEETKDDPKKHSLIGAEMLDELGVDREIVQAVRVHNEEHGIPRETLMDKALYAVDPLTGLIVAAALIHPDKKISSIDTGFVMNRFGEKHFAKGANRENIKACQDFGMDLDEFVEIGVAAMQEVSSEIGL